MARLLILFAHPALEKSRVHRQLLPAAQNLAQVTVHDLYEAYPTFDIDVDREQELLLNHDLIVLQHPFYWYSTPPIVKQWEDLVLEHNWAYGSKGNALRGKQLLNAITAGGREQAYQPAGYNRFTIRQFLAPIEQTAVLCGMRYLPPFVVFGTHRMDSPAIQHAAACYRRLLIGLRDEVITPELLDHHAVITPDTADSILTGVPAA